jgi:predicted dehydrogenase
VTAVLEETGGEAVIDVTVPAAHTAVNIEALFAGVPVLCEKPAAPTVADALEQSAASRATGRLLMISQSRRYYAALERFRLVVADIGGAGLLTTDFFRAPHFGGFREEMAYPLLVDMAIHAFDAARLVMGADPVAVSCQSWNPAWSWFSGDAAANAVFEFADGRRYRFTGSWVAAGLETSWNGEWRASGSGGSATWDGEHLVRSSLAPDDQVVPSPAEEIAGALAEFVAAVRTGASPSGAIAANIPSLAMVEAAVRSAETSTKVDIVRLIEDALDEARARPVREEIRDVFDRGITLTA